MKSRVYRGVAAMLISFAAAAFCSEGTSDSAASTRYREQAADGIDTLQKWYNEGNGLYETTGWWNSANAVTVVVDYSRLAKTRRYVWTVANTFHIAQRTSPGFINNFYDDEGWWALAWIDAYDLTHSLQYRKRPKVPSGGSAFRGVSISAWMREQSVWNVEGGGQLRRSSRLCS
ncbi:MAG TPA: hypothetical protein VGG85_01345 [Terracidiphilus sp.]